MPELDISVIGAEPARHAAVPTLLFRLAIRQRGPDCPIQNISLQCQVRIETTRRFYKPAEKERLSDLFGDPARWKETLRSMLWTHAAVSVPAFEGECEVDLPVPCSFDFNVAATKYFHGLEYDKVPLLLLFSGSVFYRGEDGALSMDRVSWNEETNYRLPVQAWKDMMEAYYPNSAWLCINRRVFDALYAYKRQHGFTGFDEALMSVLQETSQAAS